MIMIGHNESMPQHNHEPFSVYDVHFPPPHDFLMVHNDCRHHLLCWHLFMFMTHASFFHSVLWLTLMIFKQDNDDHIMMGADGWHDKRCKKTCVHTNCHVTHGEWFSCVNCAEITVDDCWSRGEERIRMKIPQDDDCDDCVWLVFNELKPHPDNHVST